MDFNRNSRYDSKYRSTSWILSVVRHQDHTSLYCQTLPSWLWNPTIGQIVAPKTSEMLRFVACRSIRPCNGRWTFRRIGMLIPNTINISTKKSKTIIGNHNHKQQHDFCWFPVFLPYTSTGSTGTNMFTSTSKQSLWMQFAVRPGDSMVSCNSFLQHAEKKSPLNVTLVG